MTDDTRTTEEGVVMKLKDLLDKATPSPWLNWAVTIRCGKNAHGEFARVNADDADLIVALRNNAEAFIELWEAAESVEDWLADSGVPLESDLRRAVEALRPLMEATRDE